jgi:large subunit ribosomal protein L35
LQFELYELYGLSETGDGIVPKAKTSRSAAKRFKKTAKGKLARMKSGSGHNFTSKTRKRKRQIRKSGTVAGTDEKRMKRLLPG